MGDKRFAPDKGATLPPITVFGAEAEVLGNPEMAAIANRKFLELVPIPATPKRQANLKPQKRGDSSLVILFNTTSATITS